MTTDWKFHGREICTEEAARLNVVGRGIGELETKGAGDVPGADAERVLSRFFGCWI